MENKKNLKRKDARKPDIKIRYGNISIAGWIQDEEEKHTLFHLTKSYRESEGKFKTFTFKMTQPQMIDTINLIHNALNENHFHFIEEEEQQQYSEEKTQLQNLYQ